MEALVFDGVGKMSVRRLPVPEPAADELLVRVTAVGICGSELTSFTGASKRRAPGRVFGHEIAGEVVAATGPGNQSLVGERVAVNPLRSCGHCRHCMSGRANICPDRVLLGMQIDGGFAEFVAVPAASIAPLAELDEIAGSLVEPIANAVHVERLLPGTLGRRIAVLGAGAIGLSVVAVLRAAGARTVTVIDPVATRRQAALATGADAALAPDGDSADFEHVVDAAGTAGSRNAAIARCEPGGSVVLLGLHSATSELEVNAAVAKELRLQCSYAYTPEDFTAAHALLGSGSIPYEHWITERPLAEGHAAFATLVNEPEAATKVVLRPPP